MVIGVDKLGFFEDGGELLVRTMDVSDRDGPFGRFQSARIFGSPSRPARTSPDHNASGYGHPKGRRFRLDGLNMKDAPPSYSTVVAPRCVGFGTRGRSARTKSSIRLRMPRNVWYTSASPL